MEAISQDEEVDAVILPAKGPEQAGIAINLSISISTTQHAKARRTKYRDVEAGHAKRGPFPPKFRWQTPFGSHEAETFRR
jgi:hypothetical protein